MKLSDLDFVQLAADVKAVSDFVAERRAASNNAFSEALLDEIEMTAVAFLKRTQEAFSA